MKLPTAQDLGGRPTPEPSLGVARYQPVTGEGEVAKAVIDLGDTLGREQERADKMRAEDDFNTLLDAKTDLTVGEKNGYVNYKGRNAISRPLLQEYSSRLDAKINEISGKMANGQQRAFFARRAAIVRLQLREGIQQHQFAEAKKADATTLEKSTRMGLQNIQLQPLNQQRFDEEVVRVSGIINNMNISEDDKNLAKSIFISTAHITRIENVLASGQDVKAKEFYADAVKKNEIYDPEGTLKKKVEENSSILAGSRAAKEAWSTAGPKSDASLLNKEAMDKTLREKFPENPTALKAARAELDIRINNRTSDIKERDDFNSSEVMKRIEEGKSIPDVIRTKEYQNLDGVKRMQVLDYMKNRSKGIENLTPDQLRSYAILSQTENLGKMSPAAVMSTALNIGPELAGMLLKQKEAMGKDPSVTTPSTILNFHLRKAGVNLENKANKALEGNTLYKIEKDIYEQEKMLGRVLTRPEKEDLIEKAVVKVRLENPFWFDPEKIVAVLTPEQKAKAYIEIKEIDPRHVLNIKKRAATLGVKKSLSDIEIGRAYFIFHEDGDVDTYLKSLK